MESWQQQINSTIKRRRNGPQTEKGFTFHRVDSERDSDRRRKMDTSKGVEGGGNNKKNKKSMKAKQ
ncbi:hypothetical protein Dsin_011282 [Dipteronia sinensis]|uniref:Uncharacterized protein n=1 Tax=Dipteronia sinensis TaxID=43782 RepID=A0AAE0EDW3_9ROSI|nr:hypothetical protein Dsin_011282 [Dipteronia sinensis]